MTANVTEICGTLSFSGVHLGAGSSCLCSPLLSVCVEKEVSSSARPRGGEGFGCSGAGGRGGHCLLGGCGYIWREGRLQGFTKPGSFWWNWATVSLLVWFFIKKFKIVETSLSSALTYQWTSGLAFAGYFCVTADYTDVFRIQITILQHASSIQNAIIVTAKSETSAWGRILQFQTMKVLLWDRPVTSYHSTAPLFGSAQVTSSDHASTLHFFYSALKLMDEKCPRSWEGLEELLSAAMGLDQALPGL